jgi:hypothetical protein
VACARQPAGFPAGPEGFFFSFFFLVSLDYFCTLARLSASSIN